MAAATLEAITTASHYSSFPVTVRAGRVRKCASVFGVRTIPKYACKTDNNHRAIKRALEKAGCSVTDLSRAGGGVPDLLVARAGSTALVEVKGRRGRLTPDQERFLSRWRGRVYIVRTVEDAIDVSRDLG